MGEWVKQEAGSEKRGAGSRKGEGGIKSWGIEELRAGEGVKGERGTGRTPWNLPIRSKGHFER
jgi:hypothetical protein